MRKPSGGAGGGLLGHGVVPVPLQGPQPGYALCKEREVEGHLPLRPQKRLTHGIFKKKGCALRGYVPH